jgi:hypothetical protein
MSWNPAAHQLPAQGSVSVEFRQVAPNTKSTQQVNEKVRLWHEQGLTPCFQQVFK